MLLYRRYHYLRSSLCLELVWNVKLWLSVCLFITHIIINVLTHICLLDRLFRIFYSPQDDSWSKPRQLGLLHRPNRKYGTSMQHLFQANLKCWIEFQKGQSTHNIIQSNSYWLLMKTRQIFKRLQKIFKRSEDWSKIAIEEDGKIG